jgi:Kef-type K+ transport system membrane component KefB
MLLFAAGLTLAALVGKLACGLGVVTPGVRRLAVGVGMVPRGEVGLIFAGLGVALMIDGQPLLSPAVFSAVVIMVLVTTLVAPAGLRWVFSRPPS